jgi:hypothetical protein
MTKMKDNFTMTSEEFHKFFVKAITDKEFRQELAHDGFGALERHGLDTSMIPDDIRSLLARLPFDDCEGDLIIMEKAGGTTTTPTRRKPRCGVCGVCGVCTLCGEINFGSGSAALWALFALA